jgi:peptide/nickel transport system substrate-binding protein
MTLLLALLCGCPRGGAKVTSKTITVGIQQEPDSLFAPFREMIAAEEILRAGAPTLTVFNDRWELVPSAAVAIPTVENGGVVLLKDGRMVTTFVIRDDVFWADGTPLTADDYVFCLSIYQDPAQEIADRSYAELVEKMEALGADHKTLRITWKQPYAYHANYRNFEALPRHVVEPIYKVAGGALKQHPWGGLPMLAGPFTVDAWERGQYVALKRNPFAKSPRISPQVDRVVWRIIPNSQTLEANLLSGAVDAVSPVGLQLDQALEMQRRVKDAFEFHFNEGLQWEHIDFNLDDPWLKDVRMRQALTLGMNRAAMTTSLFADKQPVAHTYNPPRRHDYEPNVVQYGYDPARAQALLEEMGFKRGADGIYEKDGKRLSLTLTSTAGLSTRERVEQILQADLKKVGVELVIENVPAKVLFGELTRRRKFKHLVMFAWLFDPLKGPDTYWRCDQIPSEANAWQGQNYGGWCNAEVTDLLKQAGRELDATKRTEMLKRVQRVWAEQLPAVPLFFRSDVSVTRKGFKNWKPTGTLSPVTWNVQEWQLP